MKKAKSNTQFTLPNIKDWHAIITIVALVAIFFRDVLLQKSFFWEDFIYQFYPFRNFAAVSLANGELPLWNPYTFSGTPFQADIQSALFYIPNLLLTLFVSGGRLHFFWLELLIIAHIMIAGITMYYLAKDFGILRLYSIVSGVVFALSGFMIAHVIHQVIICQVAWFPLILLLFRRALLKRSLLHMILGGLVLGHAVLAGFPQVSLYIFFLLFIYFLFEFGYNLKENGINPSLSMIPFAAGVIILAIAFTAIQLLPTIELAPLSQRAEITFEKSQEGQLSWPQLLTVVVPKFFGSSNSQGSTFWGGGAFWVYWETCFYMGVPALVLALFSLLNIKKNRYVGFFLAITIFSVLYALGDNFIFHKFFFQYVPGFSKFRSIGRMTLLATFGLSLLSGIGLQTMTDMIMVGQKNITKILLMIGGGGIFLWILIQSGVFQPSNAKYFEQVHSTALSETTTAVVMLLLAIGIIVFIRRKTLSVTAGVAALVVLQFVDMNIFGFEQNNGSINPGEYYASTARFVQPIREEMKSEYFRVNSRRENAMILDRNQGMIDRIFLMEGYTPLALQRNYPVARDFDRCCELLNAKYQTVIDKERQAVNLIESSTYVPRAFFVYKQDVISDENKVKDFMMSDAFDPLKVVVLEEDTKFSLRGNDDSTKSRASITSYSLNEITLNVSTPKNGYLVLSEIYYPGWKAYIDGIPSNLFRADWSLRAIPVEAGTHKVDVIFEPASFYRGAWITFATIGLSALGIVYSLRKKKTTEQQSKQPI